MAKRLDFGLCIVKVANNVYCYYNRNKLINYDELLIDIKQRMVMKFKMPV